MEKKNRPVVGIVGYAGHDSKNYGCGINYLDWVDKYIGNPIIIMPWQEKAEIDLLLLPGGLDVNPASYSEVPGFKTTNTDVFKQYFFDERLKNYVGNTPIVGICLGAQQLNVHCGGSLTQNLQWHETSSGRYEKAHKVFSEAYKHNPESKIKYNDGIRFEVNSHHHQGIKEDQLAKVLLPLLYSESGDGIDFLVEAFYSKELNVLGVQWHPEEWEDAWTIKMVRNMLPKER